MGTEITVAIISGIAVIIAGIITYYKDLRIKQIEIENREMKARIADENDIINEVNIKIHILDKLANFAVFSEIRSSVDRMFSETKADRFLLLFAINGKKDFRTVSVIFEQHKHPQLKVNAIIRYRDIQIDDEYRRLLKNVEALDEINLNIETMPNQLLRDFYIIERVSYSKLKFLHRKTIDETSDIVMFASIATHEHEPFDNLDNAIIKSEIEGTVIHVIKQYI